MMSKRPTAIRTEPNRSDEVEPVIGLSERGAPLVSVVVPCFNQARFLGDAVTSLKAQTISSWECLIVDDGSTDDTSRVAAALAEDDTRVTVLRQRNRGLSGARNAGIARSRGRYIQLLDADDVIVRDKFEIQLAVMSEAPDLVLSYTDFRYCPEHDITLTASRDNFAPPRLILERPLWDIATRWETELSIPTHCFLFDARIFTQHGVRFDESLPSHEDWDCWMQVFALEPRVIYVPQKLAIYRLHEQSMTRHLPSMRKGFDAALAKQIAVHADDTEMRERLTRKRDEMRVVYGASGLSLRRRVIRRLRGSTARRAE